MAVIIVVFGGHRIVVTLLFSVMMIHLFQSTRCMMLEGNMDFKK